MTKYDTSALGIYFLSCAVVDIDYFIERHYLKTPEDALNIPQDMRAGIEEKLRQQKRRFSE